MYDYKTPEYQAYVMAQLAFNQDESLSAERDAAFSAAQIAAENYGDGNA